MLKLKKLDLSNFQIVADAEIDLETAPLHLFAGDNRQGKTTVLESLRYALKGVPTRVENKKNQLKQLIRDGAKKGGIELHGEDGSNTVSLPSGEVIDGLNTRDNIHIDFLLSPALFGSISADARRSYVFSLTNPDTSMEIIRKKLVKAKCDPEKIEAALPLTLAGFDSALEEVKKRASEARISWKALAGEAYGSNKADDWKAEKPEFNPEEVEKLESEFLAADQQRMELFAKVQAARENAKATPAGFTPETLICPCCDEDLAIMHGSLVKHPGQGTKAIPATDDALDALTEAQNAYDAATANVAALRDRHLEAIRNRDKATTADEKTAAAHAHHVNAVQWGAIADQFAPDGIPAELLADALKPMNNRLRASATATGWEQVTVMPDLSILVGGRLRGLDSESGQWRADAQIAEAISFLSGTGFLCLDRVDMLTPPDRAQLVKWLNNIAHADEIATAVCFMAVPTEPTGLPTNWAVHWIENGVIEAQ